MGKRVLAVNGVLGRPFAVNGGLGRHLVAPWALGGAGRAEPGRHRKDPARVNPADVENWGLDLDRSGAARAVPRPPWSGGACTLAARGRRGLYPGCRGTWGLGPQPPGEALCA